MEMSADNLKMKVENVDLWYSGHQVLHDISLSFPERNVTALIGPSGCGKSTLIRCLNRMNDLIPGCRTTGRVELNGRDIMSDDTDIIGLRRAVGMVFQRPNPFPFSIYENVAYGPRMAGIDLITFSRKLLFLLLLSALSPLLFAVTL